VLAAAAALAALWVLVAVNVLGVRNAGWVQLITTLLKILPLAGVGVAGLFYFEPSHFSIEETRPLAMAGTVSSVVTLTLWAFLGLESCTVPAGSIDKPETTIPRATLIGTILTAVLYIASTVGVMSVIDPDVLARSPAPFADAARALAGERAAQAVAAGAAISCFGALNGWILLCGQLSAAVARDGLFPRIFARTSGRGTPAAGMIIAGALTTGLVAVNYTRGLVELFTFFILLATLSTLVPFAFSALAVFILRDEQSPLPRAAALASALAFLYALWAIGGAGQPAVYWGFLLLISGLPVYVIVVGRRQDPSSVHTPALAHRTMTLNDGAGRGALEGRIRADANEGQPVLPGRGSQSD
jgi:APA family basic amino acid/polyamine antiporter